MKKKILLAIVAVLSFCSFAFGLTACAKKQHEHTYIDTVVAPTCTDLGYTEHICQECQDKYVDTFVAALGHSFNSYVSNGNATCTQDGTKTATCDREGCNERVIVTDEGSKLGHSFNSYVSNNNATCTEDGTKTATCDREGCSETHTVTDEGTKLGHDFNSYVSNNDATCTQDGTKTATCDRNGCSEIHTVTDEGTKLGHIFNNYVSDNNATCTQDGTKTATCDREGCSETHTVTDEGSKLGHELVHHDAKAPTCTEVGWEEYDTCSRCDYTTYVELPTHTRVTVEENRVEATCEQDGHYDSVVYCSVCHAELSRETMTINKIGHSYRAPVLTWNGYTSVTATFTCSNDISHVARKTATGSAITSEVITQPTCTSEGLRKYTATVTFNGETCTTTKTATIEAMGHSYEISECVWSNDNKRATITLVCATDSDHVEILTATSANISSTVTTQPTCTTDGIKTYTATVTLDGKGYRCTTTSVIDKLGHSFTNYISNGNATCTEDGTKTATCDRCDATDTITDEGTKLGHSYGAPVWTWTGYTSAKATFTCSHDSAHVEEVTATSEAITSAVTTPATCTAAGVRTYTAKVNFGGAEYTDTATEDVAATGHTWSDNVCTVCSHDAGGSKGLNMVLNTETNSYSLNGKGTCSATQVVIPAIYNELSVTAIGAEAFADCATLESIVIPESVTAINNGAFAGCSALIDVYYNGTAEDWNGISKGENAFPAGATIFYYSKTEPSLNADETAYDGNFWHYVDGTATKWVHHIHVAGEGWITDVEPTCEVDGSKHKECTICRKTLETTSIDKLGHSYGEPVWTWTGYTSAKATFTCANDNTHVETVTATGDAITSVVTTEPTCTVDGEIEYTATVTFGGKPYSKVTVGAATKLGHSFTSYISNGNATCTQDGTKTATCDRCDATDTITDEGTMLPHTWSDNVCTVCGYDAGGSKGLSMVLNAETNTYTVKGKGTFSSGGLTIPSTYNGLPVTEIAAGALKELNCVAGKIIIGEGITKIGDEAFSNSINVSTIILPDSLTSIGARAFEGCYKINTVTMGNGLISIGDKAFKGCELITAVALPETVASIGSGAFEGCKKLASVNIPVGITQINSSVLYGCSALTSITIPEGVESIGFSAFQNCSAIESFIIPDSVTSIDFSAFQNCCALKSIKLPKDLTVISTSLLDGCKVLESIDLPNSLKKIGNYAFRSCYALASIKIPEGVESIGSSAFGICSSLTGLTIPASVTSIGACAFKGCTTIKSIVIPATVTSVGGGLFSGCTNLTSVTLNDSVTGINYQGDGFFAGCVSLESVIIPQSVTSIGQSAFDGCTALKVLTLPEDVTSIGDYAFRNCESLENISIPDKITSVGGEVFAGCYSLKFNTEGNVKYLGNASNKYVILCGVQSNTATEFTIQSGTKIISDYAFKNCNSFTSITIPEGVVSIGRKAFYNCASLETAAIQGGSIGNYAFENCSALKSVTIGKNVTAIGIRVFQYDIALKDLTIENGLTSIGEAAFQNCISLESVVIPDSVETIDRLAFSLCRGLKTVTLGKGVTSIYGDAFNYSYKILEVYNLSKFEITAGSSDFGGVAQYAVCVYTSKDESSKLTTDDANGFVFYKDGDTISLVDYTGSETALTLPKLDDGQTYSIKQYAFRERYLTSVTIPACVTSIGEGAFSCCYALTSVTIGKNVTAIGNYAFSYCYDLLEVYNLSALTITKGSKDNGGVGQYAINVYTSESGSSLFTTDANGFVFYNDGGGNVYLVGYSGSATELTLPTLDDDKTYSVYAYAFSNCKTITSVIIPDCVTSISNYAFAHCNSLKSVTVEDSSIGNYAFYYCRGLSSVTIKKGTIGTQAFENCVALRTLTVGGGVTSIVEKAFKGCTALTQVVIEEGVPKIGHRIFSECTALESVVIPKSVTSIGTNVFWNCNALNSIYYGGTEEEWDGINYNIGNVARYYYSETKPALNEEGNFWHYVDGKPVVWVKETV